MKKIRLTKQKKINLAPGRQHISVYETRDDGVLFQMEDRPPARAAILLPWLKNYPYTHDGRQTKQAEPSRSADARMQEAIGLALAIDLEIAFFETVKFDKNRPSTLFGKGKVEDLKTRLKTEEIELVVVDGSLSPVQQRNLERSWGVKILDRTGLILEIFGRRAQTSEGRLQVELAHLSYQKTRLVRSWTHLERQRGGLSFVGGPGETQIEADRRQLQKRITRLSKQLDKVRRTRQLHRVSRRKVPYPVLALVGYTNAGKSTLFNTLTKAEVPAQNLLFATLDPTMRSLDLPHGACVILSDTVGFISDLPTDLVAAFRATLEEVHEADIIIHVRDISHSDSAAQDEDVRQVLVSLGIKDDRMTSIIEVWNKIDLLDDDTREALLAQSERRDDVVAVSAISGQGVDHLFEVIEARLAETSSVIKLVLGGEQGADIHWLYETCEVMTRTDRQDGTIAMEIRVPAIKLAQVRKRFPAQFATSADAA
jgi:GTPase